VSKVLEITRKFTLLGKLRHYLFECPTKPAFKCPVCDATYRCWDGNDVGGKINVCKKCTRGYDTQGGWIKEKNGG
jgi:hypothetical protein